MYLMHRHSVKSAVCSLKLHKYNSFLELFPCQSMYSIHHAHFVSHFRAGSFHHSADVTALGLKQKIRKLDIRYKNDLSLTPHSLNGILNDPLFATHVSKKEGWLLLKCCELINEQFPEARVQYTWRIWKTLKKLDMVDLKSFHYFLLALLSTGVKIELNTIFTSLPNRCTPTNETYNLFLRCACQNNNFDDIRSIISSMTEKGYCIDAQGQYAIVYATAKCSGFDSAIQYIRDVPLKMNSNVYSSLLRSLAETSNVQLFNRLFTEARQNGFEFEVEDRISIAESLIKGNLNSLIPNVLGEKIVWRSNLGILFNLCVRSVYLKRYGAAYVIINHAKEFLTFPIPAFQSPATLLTYAEFITVEMVKSKMPLADILQFCYEGNVTLRLNAAAYASLRNRVFDYSLDLFEAMKQNGLPLRPHYFWPLLLSNNGEQSIFGVLSAMKALEVSPDFDTLVKYVYPFVDTSSTAAVLEKLKQTGIDEKDSVTPLIAVLLQQCRLTAAIELRNVTYGTRLNRTVIYEQLYHVIAEALVKTKDFESVVKICKYSTRLPNVFHHLIHYHKDKIEPEMVKKFINVFKENKIGLFGADLNELRRYLSERNLTDITLDSLSNEVNTVSGRPHLRNMNIQELEKFIVHLKENNYSTRQALRRLLIMHAEVGNIDRVLEVKKELEDKNYKFSTGMKGSLIKTFCRKNEFEHAYEIYLDFKNADKVEELAISNIIQLATVAAKQGDLKVMYEILKSRTNPRKSDELTNYCVNLIRTVIEYHGSEAEVELLKFLIEKNYCTANIELLAPIIKRFLSRQDVERAVLTCLNYGNRYRILPMRNTVLSALASLSIEEKSSQKEPKFEILLNKFLQMSGYLYGRSYTNMMYVVCLAKIDMLATLKSFLMESYTGIDEKIMWTECNRLADKNDLKALINLETVFKDMPNSMEPIYINLLKIYSRNKDLESAEKLLKSLEDTNRLPSVTFLNMYAELQNGNDNN